MRIAVAVICLLLAHPALAQVRNQRPAAPAGMKTVEGKYHYLIYDLTDAEAAEVLLRMEAMVDEYVSRTREFSGRLTGKLAFIIFRHAKDYRAAGGMGGSAGMFDGEKLMAVAGEELGPSTWHVIQHEGFHQFARAVIGGDMPTWVDEGLAEYFGEAVYTGDGFVAGVIPSYRRERIGKLIDGGEFKSVAEMMGMSLAKWNANLQVTNYDQAFAMVSFLAHGDDGKYQKAFGQFIRLLNERRPWKDAWLQSFGSAGGFEQRMTDYWKKLPEDPSLEGYATAATQMLGSYLARATAQKQPMGDIDALVAAIEKGDIKFVRGQELPPSLGKSCLGLLDQLKKRDATFELLATGKNPQQAVVCKLKDGATITVTFKLTGRRVAEVKSKIERPKAKAK